MNGFFNDIKKLSHLVRYHRSIFFRKIRPYPPLGFWLVYLGVAYQQVPLCIVQNYLASAMISFYIMVWFGYLFLSDFDEVMEHLLLLQINSRFLYVASKIVFLIAVSALVGVIGSVFPIIIKPISLLAGYAWPVDVGAVNFIGGLLLHFVIGCMGVSVAFLFQPNPEKRNNSSIATLALMLFALLAVVKNQAFNIDGLARHVLLVFTPLYEILQLFSESEVFTASDMLLAVIGGSAYFLLAVAFGYWFYNKRVYGPLIAKQN